MTKRYSIAEARDSFARVVHETEVNGPVELTRRGERVAVLLSAEEFDRLHTEQHQPAPLGLGDPAWTNGSTPATGERCQPERPSFGEALQKWRDSIDWETTEITGDEFDNIRDSSPGRDFHFPC